MKHEDQNQLIQDIFLLQRVAQKINSNLDLDALLEEIVNDVSQTFACSRLAVFLKDDQTNELVVGEDCGGEAEHYIKGERIKIGEFGIVGHVAATGETYYAPDVTSDPYYEVGDDQTRSEVAIPLRSRGQLIGVFNAEHKELDGFSPSRIQLLEALAGHVATAIENARMFQRERMEKERMLAELSEAQRIQQALFPDRPPAIPRFAIHGMSQPCQEVGGDWYDYIFSEHKIAMPPGSRLVFYSDGVTEAMNSSLEQYGETRLRDHLANPSASAQSLLNDVRTFTGGHSASDDVTVVMVQADEYYLK